MRQEGLVGREEDEEELSDDKDEAGGEVVTWGRVYETTPISILLHAHAVSLESIYISPVASNSIGCLN